MLRGVALLAAPALLCGVMGSVLGRASRVAPALRLIGSAACAGLLAERFEAARDGAAKLLDFTARAANVLAPTLISAAALTGAGPAAAGFTPASALCASAIENLLRGAGLWLCAVAAVLAAAGGLSEGMRPDRLFALGKGAALWLCGGVVAAFMGLMTMEGLLSSGRGGAAARTAHYALESLVPLIGGEVSEAMDALLASARLVRSAVGVTGMTAVALACAEPMATIVAASLSAKLAGAAADLAGEHRVARMAGRFSEAMDMLAAVCVAAVLLVLLLAGGILSLGRN